MRVPVQVLPAYGRSYSPDRLAYVKLLSNWLDSRFEIAGIKFGIDPIVGLLLPGIGSVGTSLVSLALVATVAKHGASRHVIVRMLLNVLIDTVIGSIPLIGSIFDIAFRANDRNVELLRRHYEERRYQGSGWWLIALLIGALVATCVAVAWLTIAAIAWIVDLF